ncbi:hypothetical protein [Limosilactobacillus avium]|uniref:hypothetical protein n=1 Tax=Limosilactobacillus avium TaxID=2991831 RepID=UPI0024BBB13B|nr:hypothetical protein [Limosilactobacillus avium]
MSALQIYTTHPLILTKLSTPNVSSGHGIIILFQGPYFIDFRGGKCDGTVPLDTEKGEFQIYFADANDVKCENEVAETINSAPYYIKSSRGLNNKTLLKVIGNQNNYKLATLTTDAQALVQGAAQAQADEVERAKELLEDSKIYSEKKENLEEKENEKDIFNLCLYLIMWYVIRMW